MDDSEKTTDSLLSEEALSGTGKNSGDDTGEVAEDTMESNQVGDLVEGGIENEHEDVEMADGVAEDSENNNLAPEDSMDAPATILEGEDGSGDVSQGTLSTSEGYQFISQTDALIVQNEPPQQLMEEAEGENEIGEGLIGEHEDEADALPEVDPSDKHAIDQSEELNEGEEESLLLQEGEEEGAEDQDDSQTVDLGALPEGITLISDQDGNLIQATDGADEQGNEAEDQMELRLEGDEEDGTEGDGILGEADHLEGALSELEGKIAAGPDESVQLLAGQENLQGMQLMEGDDKPDEEAAAAAEATEQEIQAQLQLHAAILKQEEMKMEQEEEPEGDAYSGDQASAEADALATLASAALDHQAPTNGVKNELDEPQLKTEQDNAEPQWMDVGICKGTHCQVRTYYIPRPGQSWDQDWDGITTSTLPDHRALAKLELESGKAYKFRVAAINSCGRGPWSEVAAFKTSLPGFPGAPSAIKIAKTADGAHLSWEPPPIASGVIEDYHVYLAVRTATTETSRVVSSGANQLAFVRIYQGAANQCSVGNDTLSKAHIDMTTKPAILFRISARNEKGIGPATQVRWLQEEIGRASCRERVYCTV